MFSILLQFPMKTDGTLGNSAHPQQKHKHRHLQEQLSSHILKRRMSGEQQRQPKSLQPQQQQQQQIQSSQEQMQLLEEHIKQHIQEQNPQNLQVFKQKCGSFLIEFYSIVAAGIFFLSFLLSFSHLLEDFLVLSYFSLIGRFGGFFLSSFILEVLWCCLAFFY